jgi:pimeloyl-ACP methyl ester carboxylesterase
VTVAEPQWETLPATPILPRSARSGYAPVNGTKIWYAVFGRGNSVILLHGGLANSNYWGNQVPALAKHYQVIVMDSRGHGRSFADDQPLTYELMASDVLGLMDFLKINRAAIVGWGDGANLGLYLAIKYPERLIRLFAFAGNSNPKGKHVSKAPVFSAYRERTEKEYQTLSPRPEQYKQFVAQVTKMWATQPHFTAEKLKGIKVPTWIVDADHEEAVRRENTLFLSDQIPGAALLIEPAVSHFSFLQDPRQFNEDVLHFLEGGKKQ